MRVLNIRNLGFGAKASLCWSFFWRGIVVTIGSMLAGGALGFLFGAAVALVSGQGHSPSMAQVAQWGGAGLGFLSGAFFLYLYVRWLLGARLGSYRLVLVTAESASVSAP